MRIGEAYGGQGNASWKGVGGLALESGVPANA